MKVVINSLSVPSCRQGGAGFYTSTLVDGLARSGDVECVTLASRQVAGELGELAPEASVTVAEEKALGAVAKAANRAVAAWRPWQLDLGFSGPAPAADLTHWPIAFMNAPYDDDRGGARVLTIHDLQHEFFPQFFSRRDRLLRRLRWRPSARAADHIVTISEFSRRTICERFGIAEEKITAVPLAVRETLSGGAEDVRLPDRLQASEAPWVVYPASPLPAKNHLRLLDALKLQRERSGHDLHLVLTGPTMHSWESIERGVAVRGLEDCVVRLGHVGEAALAGLYRRSNGLVFPSLFEGFGLPVLEAMAAGCPVAASSAGSLPEIAGGVGRSFAPDDVEQIAAALDWLMELSPAEHEGQAAAGHERASHFTLDRLVEGTRAAYEKVL